MVHRASSAGRLAAWHRIVEQVFGPVIPKVVSPVWQRPRGCPPCFHMLIAVALLALIAACTPSRAAGDTTPPAHVSPECVTALAPLTTALTDLDSRLSVGMPFATYRDKVADARVAYDRIPFATLDADCILGLGKPEEDAMNAYQRAFTVWKACTETGACKDAAMKKQLQAEWATASTALAAAKGRLP